MVQTPVPLVVCPNGFVDFKKNYSEAEINQFYEFNYTLTSYQTFKIMDNTDYYLFAKILEHAGAE